MSITITSVSYNSFYRSTGDTVCGTDGVNVCSLAIGTQAWHSGSGTVPEEGQTVYSTSNGTIFNGGGFCYAFWPTPDDGTGDAYYATISSSGIVGAVALCSE